jgi:hypothetical protein
MSHLGVAGAVTDEDGMASAVLAAEVGYPGSSIAFAQLLSGMQRSGLIEREVRGKRTYRIAAAPGAAARAAVATQRGSVRRPAGPGPVARRAAAAPPAGDTGADLATGPPGVVDFDYDELARRLLIQVVRQLASAPGADAPAPDGSGLERTVAGLQQELASVRTMHGTLIAENARLREQLRTARRSLALAHDRPGGPQLSDQLDAAEVNLLERLLTPAEKDSRGADAETG